MHKRYTVLCCRMCNYWACMCISKILFLQLFYNNCSQRIDGGYLLFHNSDCYEKQIGYNIFKYFKKEI